MGRLAPIAAAILTLTLLSLAAPAGAQLECNCPNASLRSTSVSAHYTTSTSTSPTVASTVGFGTEIPNAGPVFAMGGPAPRLDINYESASIELRFLGTPQTYAPGTSFTFSNLYPTHPGPIPSPCALAAEIVAIKVHTGKTGASFVAANASFTPHSVTVPLADSTGFSWGQHDSMYVTLTYDCGSGTSTSPTGTCCPPWNATQLKSMLSYQGAGSITQPYTLKFGPTAAFHTQMNTYLAYLQSLGLGFTSIAIKFELLDGGTGSASSPSGAPLSTQTITWTGSGNPAAAFFSAGLTNPNRWYRVRTTLILNGGPGSSYLPSNCMGSSADVRFQVI